MILHCAMLKRKVLLEHHNLKPLSHIALCPIVPYFIILLCLMPDNFTHQRKSACTQWVKFGFDNFLGILGTIGALAYGAYAYKNRGPMSTSRYLMRLRVIAQSMVVGAIMVGVGYTAIKEKQESKHN